MDIRFQPNNSHLDNAATFAKTDPHLRRLFAQKYVHYSKLLDELPQTEPGIITLGGGRQVGKTTLLKQWMAKLLGAGVAPESICFFSGELISDHQSLYTLLKNQLAVMPSNTINYLILDEITDIDQWDKTIKYLADLGEFSNVIVVLSGSDLVLMQDARKRIPGRRGKNNQVDFHYYPLSFAEFIKLKDIASGQDLTKELPSLDMMQILYEQLQEYLIHGGFLTAINDYAMTGRILPATLATYSDWIRGDVLKRDKREHYLKEIIEAIIKHYNKQISWDNLVKELSIDHTQTVANYVALLESMDAVFVQSAIIEDKLKAAPKKRKKLMFCDPFIFHAMRSWLEPTNDPFTEQMLPLFSDPEWYSELIESCVITHFRRFFPTYYIKAKGEVDIAYVNKKRFWPVEIKWTNQLRAKDLKQITKYKNSVIYSKINTFSTIHDIPVLPLPIALLRLDGINSINSY